MRLLSLLYSLVRFRRRASCFVRCSRSPGVRGKQEKKHEQAQEDGDGNRCRCHGRLRWRPWRLGYRAYHQCRGRCHHHGSRRYRRHRAGLRDRNHRLRRQAQVIAPGGVFPALFLFSIVIRKEFKVTDSLLQVIHHRQDSVTLYLQHRDDTRFLLSLLLSSPAIAAFIMSLTVYICFAIYQRDHHA